MSHHVRTLALAALAVLSLLFLAGSVAAYRSHSSLYDSFAPSYYGFSPYDSMLYAPQYTPYRSPYHYRYPSVYARTYGSLLYASDDFIYYRADLGVPSHAAHFRSVYFSPAYSPSIYEPFFG